MIVDPLDRIYQLLSPLRSQRECETCRLCEENVGLVYLLGNEAQRVERLGVTVVRTADGIEYIARAPGGSVAKGVGEPRVTDQTEACHWCSCFDPDTNRCRIYDDRPLCCRIYPLDLMRLEGQLWWVIHSECPIAQRFEKEHQLHILVAITAAIEKELTDQELQRWMKEDQVSVRIEAFSFEAAKVHKLRPFRRPVWFL
jgi:Fe-S-cluster containining protein